MPKVRLITVVPFRPSVLPFVFHAKSRYQAQRRLAESLGVTEELLRDVVDALWTERPVVLMDRQVFLVPGQFTGASYQTLLGAL